MTTSIASEKNQRLNRVIPAYILVAMLYLAVFTPLFIVVIKDPLLIAVHLIDVAVILWAQVHFTRTQDTARVSLALCLIAYLTVLSVTATGGVASSGPFLVFPYIPFVVFIRKPKSASRWLYAMLVTLIVLLVMQVASLITLPYSSATFALYIFNYVIAVLLTMAYVQGKSETDALNRKNTRELHLLNSQLEDANAKHESVILELKQRGKQLEKLNNAMVGRELKMIELKEEIKSLERSTK